MQKKIKLLSSATVATLVMAAALCTSTQTAEANPLTNCWRGLTAKIGGLELSNPFKSKSSSTTKVNTSSGSRLLSRVRGMFGGNSSSKNNPSNGSGQETTYAQVIKSKNPGNSQTEQQKRLQESLYENFGGNSSGHYADLKDLGEGSGVILGGNNKVTYTKVKTTSTQTSSGSKLTIQAQVHHEGEGNSSGNKPVRKKVHFGDNVTTSNYNPSFESNETDQGHTGVKALINKFNQTQF
ncbi:hypothetical protein [Candidatus Arthromitus sp. SFB-turkey]|uniref:hypothetical protein n=1 Tax=Candidatus Arthromitus sp. SFB-turkey TaxID=1840217 RepID=UPI0007F4BFE6|nr:hypothetical protein [Candidatus Arthromitus sp. SFB-turkey]OAT89135.1 hypothetical protein A6P36_05230 [Candidatus Arthromitus sp. SFB-turkey]